jgi:hypothetical protein
MGKHVQIMTNSYDSQSILLIAGETVHEKTGIFSCLDTLQFGAASEILQIDRYLV